MALKDVSFSVVKGVRNDVDLNRFAHADLSAGMNIDLDETGRLIRRGGIAQIESTASHSLWSNGTKAYLVAGNTMYYIDQSLNRWPVRDMNMTRVRYAEINNVVYWTDGLETGQIVGNTRSTRLGIAPPLQLSATVIPGALRAGRYMFTMTYARVNGEESGAPICGEIVLPVDGGIQLDLPTSSDTSVYEKRIYLTAWNGETPYLAGTVLNAVPTASFADMPELGAAVRTQFMTDAPPGVIIRYYAGRLWIAYGNYIWYSQPYEYGLFDRRSGFLGFDAEVRTISVVADGIFVGTSEETYWLSGTDPTQMQLQRVADYGTILGTETSVQGLYLTSDGLPGQVACWYSNKGMCIGMTGGQMKNMTGGRYIPPSAT